MSPVRRIGAVATLAVAAAFACFGLGGTAARAAGPADRPTPLRNVGVEPHLGGSIPLDLVFRDELGNETTLGRATGGLATLVAPVYFRCATLCPSTLETLTRAVGAMTLRPGRDYAAVVVSFDPADTPADAAQRRALLLRRAGRPGAGVHFLTGDSTTIARFTGALGFRDRYDPATRQFAHSAVIAVLTPEGRIARYLDGVGSTTRDVRLALVESATRRIGTVIDQVLLTCYHYDPHTGRYSLAILHALRITGGATLAGLALGIGILVRRERRGPRAERSPR